MVIFLSGIAPTARALTQLNHATVRVTHADSAAPSKTADVTLPYQWDTEQRGANGTARFVIKFAADPGAPPQALFIRRLGNSFAVDVNGVPLKKSGVHGDLYTDTSSQPQLITIPQDLLRADNTLEITIGAISGRLAGLGLVYAGSESEMRLLYRQAFRWRNASYLAVLALSAFLGLLGFLLWLRQGEDMYLYYWLSELLWAVRLSDFQLDTSPLAWPWWGIVVYSSYALAPGFICKFSLTLIARHSGCLRRLLNIQISLSVPVIAFALLGRTPYLVSVWLGFTILVCVVVASTVVRHCLVFRTTIEQRVLAVSVVLAAAIATRDMIVFRILHDYGGFPWLGFTWATFGLSMAWVITERMKRSTLAVAKINEDLALQLARRENELSTIFNARASMERHQAVIEERQRIMRDMHDGIGSQLVSAVHLVKDPDVPRSILAEQLQDALDNIKLTVDAMQDTDGNIAMLLGTLRYRLAPRFAAIGIALRWDVPPLPTVRQWTIQKSRHLQLFLFEAISNAIAHAKPTQVRFSAEHRRDGNKHEICITLIDNGTGFEVDALNESGGKGLENMRTRADGIGATFQIQSSGDGTKVKLVIPVST